MTDKKIWLVTGAGRGLGIDIAQKALAAGHAVVATGRKADRVLQAIGTTALRGGFNWSLQHIPRTCLLGFDIARSFGAFH